MESRIADVTMIYVKTDQDDPPGTIARQFEYFSEDDITATFNLKFSSDYTDPPYVFETSVTFATREQKLRFETALKKEQFEDAEKVLAELSAKLDEEFDLLNFFDLWVSKLAIDYTLAHIKDFQLSAQNANMLGKITFAPPPEIPAISISSRFSQFLLEAYECIIEWAGSISAEVALNQGKMHYLHHHGIWQKPSAPALPHPPGAPQPCRPGA